MQNDITWIVIAIVVVVAIVAYDTTIHFKKYKDKDQD
jgi:hypothetical protein